MKANEDHGSQSIGRAVDILEQVAAQMPDGARLTDVSVASGLHLATTRRIMQALVGRGLLSFDARTKKYVVGPVILTVAVLGNSWFSRRDDFVPVLDDVARRTRDTVMFSVRSGREAVCLERREGAFPIRVLSLEKGSRRPLGAGSGSLAILAYLSDSDREEMLSASGERFAAFGLSQEDVVADVAATRQQGFAVNPGRIIPGVYGVGVPILVNGLAVAAVSVAAIESRLDADRRLEIVSIIGDALSGISDIALPPNTVLRNKA